MVGTMRIMGGNKQEYQGPITKESDETEGCEDVQGLSRTMVDDSIYFCQIFKSTIIGLRQAKSNF